MGSDPEFGAQSLLPAGTVLDIFELDGIPPHNQDDERKPPQKGNITDQTRGR